MYSPSFCNDGEFNGAVDREIESFCSIMGAGAGAVMERGRMWEWVGGGVNITPVSANLSLINASSAARNTTPKSKLTLTLSKSERNLLLSRQSINPSKWRAALKIEVKLNKRANEYLYTFFFSLSLLYLHGAGLFLCVCAAPPRSLQKSFKKKIKSNQINRNVIKAHLRGCHFQILSAFLFFVGSNLLMHERNRQFFINARVLKSVFGFLFGFFHQLNEPCRNNITISLWWNWCHEWASLSINRWRWKWHSITCEAAYLTRIRSFPAPLFFRSFAAWILRVTIIIIIIIITAIIVVIIAAVFFRLLLLGWELRFGVCLISCRNDITVIWSALALIRFGLSCGWVFWCVSIFPVLCVRQRSKINRRKDSSFN